MEHGKDLRCWCVNTPFGHHCSYIILSHLSLPTCHIAQGLRRGLSGFAPMQVWRRGIATRGHPYQAELQAGLPRTNAGDTFHENGFMRLIQLVHMHRYDRTSLVINIPHTYAAENVLQQFSSM